MKARHKFARGGVPSTPKPTGGSGTKSEIADHLMAHRKSGGRVEDKEEKMHGAKAKFRLDRPGRKRGGRVGCDTAPLSSAGKGDHPHSADDEQGGPKGGQPGYRRGGEVKKKK